VRFLLYKYQNTLILLSLFLSTTNTLYSQVAVRQSMYLMGSDFSITVVEQDSSKAKHYINIAVHEIKRIEKLISSWDQQSQTYLINKNAGIKAVKIDKELFDLIERSNYISQLTDGAFDISYASMDKIWQFDGSMKEMPSTKQIKASVAKVGYQKIILNKQEKSIYLKEKGMKIAFGAIGKGYAADKAKQLLISKGVKAGVINASGDINTWGKQPNGKDWNVVIVNPLNKKKIFASSPITEGAVVTSGDYEKYVMFNNVRYTHIINPKTGYPSTEIISASVFSQKSELADALATSLFVMGIEVGLNLINQLPKIECILVNEQGQIHTSQGITIQK